MVLIIVVGGYQYYQTYKDAQVKIEQAQAREKTLKDDKVALTQKIGELGKQQEKLNAQIKGKEQEIKTHLAKIDEISQKLKQTNRNTVAAVSEQVIADDFKKAYKLEGKENIKVIQAPIAGSNWKEKVLQVPIDYVKLTITAKASQAACEQQSQLKDQVIGLKNDMYQLQTKNLQLEQEKTKAYGNGYEKAFNMYLETNKLYLDLLKAPPKVDLTPSWLEVAGGILGGLALCAI